MFARWKLRQDVAALVGVEPRPGRDLTDVAPAAEAKILIVQGADAYAG